MQKQKNKIIDLTHHKTICKIYPQIFFLKRANIQFLFLNILQSKKINKIQIYLSYPQLMAKPHLLSLLFIILSSALLVSCQDYNELVFSGFVELAST